MGDNDSSLAKRGAKLARITRQAVANNIAIAKIGAMRKAKAARPHKSKE